MIRLLPQDRARLGTLLVLIIARALFELVGVGAVAPFLQVAADSATIQRVELLRVMYEAGGFSTPQSFTVALGVAVVVALALGNALAVAVANRSASYSWRVALTLSERLFRGLLARPYSFHTQQHTAQLLRTITHESQTIGTAVVQALLTLVGQGVVIIAVVLMLFARSPLASLLLIVGIGALFTMTHAFSRARIAEAGERRHYANQLRSKVASEALSGIRELKVLQTESIPLARFSSVAPLLEKASVEVAALPLLPRYVVEVVLIAVLVTTFIVSSAQGSDPGTILPTISIYVFAGVRVMPALQALLAASTTVRANRPVMLEVLKLLEAGDLAVRQEQSESDVVQFNRELRLREVRFAHEGKDTPSLDSIDLTIPMGSAVALVGKSGSGKSTLADLIVGLHTPQDGTLEVDGTRLDTRNVRSWRKSVGYVSQNVFLADDTLKNNIAFGVEPSEIDTSRIEEAIKAAGLEDFVASAPGGLEATVGERGVRISGGQRQRIGIARAIYRQPRLLVLDEATSALDSLTEKHVLQNLVARRGEMAIILIAHRLSTVKWCDEIIVLESGRIAERGTWHELNGNSPLFRELQLASHDDAQQ
jgi:ABC-type multidrug transport system fused ATPase/permease subunit